MNRLWTSQEEWILRNEYSVKTIAEIAKKLKRTERSISVRACKLGLHRKHPRYVEWTPEMLKILNDFFPIMFNKALAKWLGVSFTTMIRKARELGLEKVDGFLDIRRPEISRMAGEAQRGKNYPHRFQKGVRQNPNGEFKKGNTETPEQKAKRSQAIKEAWKRKKAAQIKYY